MTLDTYDFLSSNLKAIIVLGQYQISNIMGCMDSATAMCAYSIIGKLSLNTQLDNFTFALISKGKTMSFHWATLIHFRIHYFLWILRVVYSSASLFIIQNNYSFSCRDAEGWDQSLSAREEIFFVRKIVWQYEKIFHFPNLILITNLIINWCLK